MQNRETELKFLFENEEMLKMDISEAVGFENVKVYASDPWYPAQPGCIKNLGINVIRK